MKHLGAINGLITAVASCVWRHQRLYEAVIFDANGSYAIAFAIMLASSVTT